eukprot:TRINITY_DN5990_c0_g1_i3.p1 TRINITY_DN5990_c0_g1~~TRINITY_DN5990_c0_g1_i3.p1  ORF type:complete len:498 (+),score=117.50 TRINITY_DN5990_c0_g1_i3:287-1780(+)
MARRGAIRLLLLVAALALLADALQPLQPWAVSAAANGFARGPKRHIVPLHRQRVPVQSDDGVVSFKSVYFGTIYLGSPQRQRFSMVFDTGSGHVIVPSMACRSETCAMHNRYDVLLSTTAQEVDYDGAPISPGAPRDQITVAFGTGEITGQFTNEELCLGVVAKQPDAPPANETKALADGNASTAATPAPAAQATEPAPECFNMRIVMATEMSEEPFASFSFDGVLGLGLDGLASAPAFSFFGVMSQAADIPEASFGVFLADSDDDFSEISFGGPNPLRYHSDLAWAPVALPDLGYWQVQISEVRVGGKTLDFCKDGQCRAVVDTGTSLIAVPGDFAEPLHDQLQASLIDSPGADGDVDCHKSAGHLLEFVIDGTVITLGPGDYARPSVKTADASDGKQAAEAAALLQGGGEAASQPSASPGVDGQSRGNDTSSNVSDTGQEQSPSSVTPPEVAAAPLKRTRKTCHPALLPLDLPEPLGPKLFIWGEPVLRKYYCPV